MHVLRRLAACAALFAALASTPLQAGIFRAYLSSTGNDANPCTLAAPCRLLPAAIAAANEGGEIWMLDSANYNTGPVTVDKDVKILAIPGAVGSIVGSGGDALIINAPLKNVTLKNLVVLNLAGGINGIRIQDAAAVFLEKLTVHEFTDPTGACIRFSSSSNVRVFLSDSFLRRCRTAIQLAQPVAAGNRSSFIVDNTRIERASATTGGSLAILHQGCIDLTLRNSVVARHDTAIQVNSLVANCTAGIQVVDSTLTRADRGIDVVNTTPGAKLIVTVRGSQITDMLLNSIIMQNTANQGAALNLDVVDSVLSRCGGGCIDLSNTAVDGTTVVQGRVYQSTLAHGTNAHLLTSGNPGGVLLSLVRSNLHNGGAVLVHGAGSVRFDGCHIESFVSSFINNGSGDVVSMGNNALLDVINAPGPTYITPTLRATF